MKTKLLKKLRRQAIKDCSIERRGSFIYLKSRNPSLMDVMFFSKRELYSALQTRWHDAATTYLRKYKYHLKESPYIW